MIPITIKDTEKKRKIDNLLKLVKNEFKKKLTLKTSIYVFFSSLQPGIFTALIVIYAKEMLNIDDYTIGLISAVLILAIVPGAYIGGILSDKYGRKFPLFIFLIILSISSLGFIFTKDILTTVILIGIVSFALNAMLSINWALVMDISNPKIGATEFSVITSIYNIGETSMATISGTLVVLIGFQNIFILLSIIILPAIISLFFVKK